LWPIKIVREPPRRAPVTFELVFAGIKSVEGLSATSPQPE
jgi:hypothetical protein